LIAILVFALAVVLLRNIPGLMNVTVLEHMPLDTGLRDAFSLFVRYAIVTVGVIVGFSQLGIGWSKVQWLVAAASVGLGFGLQEIFANFVSGIILLFERPLRVGDVVTIGDVTGSVARIQFRATTIQDWDCKELIVPNKELVTGKLVNWTLSNKTNRLEFRVGVALGSDPNRVRELLLDIAKQYPHVLPEPAPHSVMDGFGPSTMQFVLRVYLPTLDVRLQTIHDVYTNIAQRFREEGISIAFPQMDLHVIDLPRDSRTAESVTQPSSNGHTPHEAPAESPSV
jgi:potassium efflux system protein